MWNLFLLSYLASTSHRKFGLRTMDILFSWNRPWFVPWKTLLTGICSRASSHEGFQGSPEPVVNSRKSLISVQYYKNLPPNESNEPGSNSLECVFLYPLFLSWKIILNCVSMHYCYLKNLRYLRNRDNYLCLIFSPYFTLMQFSRTTGIRPQKNIA